MKQTVLTRKYITISTRLLAILCIVSYLYLTLFYNGSIENMPARRQGLESKISNLDEDPIIAKEDQEVLTDIQEDSGYELKEDLIPVLVMACNRPGITRCLDSLLKPSNRFPLIVTQDCVHENTTKTILKYSPDVLLIQQPNQETPKVPKEHEGLENYYRIARHYKWALERVFDVLSYDQVIIVEDDMEISPDFFQYFEAFLPLLKTQPDLFCVSSWNDNGKRGNVEDPYGFFRSDFFPGLGWMLRKAFWEELKPKWPTTFWDDWLRNPKQRKGRACIRPEISRTFNFGKQGVSGGLFYDDHIGKIFKNEKMVSYTGFDGIRKGFLNPAKYIIYKNSKEKDVNELSVVDVRRYLKSNYDKVFVEQVWDLATEVSTEDLKNLINSADPYSLETYWNNANLLPEDRKVSRISGFLGQDSLCKVYEDVSSKRYCGQNCRRRFRISFNRPPGDGKYSLNEQTRILKQWRLMDEIREDVARTAYMDVVTFKLSLSHQEKLYPPRCKEDNDKEPEYVMIHVAPRQKPLIN